MKPINVVCAVSINEKGILLARRSKNKSMGGFWEFPGGKVDSSESLQDALIREIKEELNEAINVKNLISSKPFSINSVKYILHAFLVNFEAEPMESTDHDLIKRFKKEDLNLDEVCCNDRFIFDSINNIF